MGVMVDVYAPRFGLACHPSWRVSAHSQETALELDVGTSTLSCDHAQRLMSISSVTSTVLYNMAGMY